MRTSEDLAYEKLKTLILEGEFPAGKFLSQRMLAEKANAVVITVRTSLRRLENEGLIENVPKWGVRIPEDTPEKIKDRYFMREILEIAAVQRIREGKPLADTLRGKLLETAAACDKMRPDAGSLKDFAYMHARFHQLIAESSGSGLLLGAMNRMNLRTVMFFNARRAWLKELSTPTEKHHQNYLEQILETPMEKAFAAIRAHLARGLSMELKYLEESKHAQRILK
jgi:DNA-binding GntR family transcriptional regulator